jgi:ribosomal protein S27AE
MNERRKCPNCGNSSLELVLDEWVCHECEYHAQDKKKAKGSFR